jgi:hypothetical protein
VEGIRPTPFWSTPSPLFRSISPPQTSLRSCDMGATLSDARDKILASQSMEKERTLEQLSVIINLADARLDKYRADLQKCVMICSSRSCANLTLPDRMDGVARCA